MDNQALLDALRLLLDRVQDGVDKESVKLSTNVTLELRGADGALKDRRELHNMVVTAGKNKLLAATGAETISQFGFVAVGTGTAAPTLTDTALGAQTARTAGALTNPTPAQLQLVASFAAGAAVGAITESALLDAATGGTMLARQTFAPVNVGASDTLAITWTLS